MKHLVRASSLAALGLLSLLSAARAQSTSEEEELAQAFGDKTTVSIATGSPQLLRRAPAVASVVTAADIAAMGATDLAEVLETIPGVHVSRSNNGYTPLYLFRGIYSELNPQVLVLQNGVPLTTLFTGSRGLIWAGYPLENIDRIEIIRGPGSALYGADAYAGVINLITKSGLVADGQVGVRVGSFASRDAWLRKAGKFGDFTLTGYLRVGQTDGQRRVISADAQSLLDGVFGTHASLAPAPVNTGHDSVDAQFELSSQHLRLRASHALRHQVGTGGGIAAALDPVGKALSRRSLVDAAWTDLDLAAEWRLDLNASLMSYSQQLNVPLQLFPPGAFGGAFPDGMKGGPSTWERQVRLSAVARFTGWQGHQLRIGVGHDDLDLYRTHELRNFAIVQQGPLIGVPLPLPDGAMIVSPVSESFMEPHRRTVSYVLVQDEWNLARDLALTAGVRHDRYSDTGSTTNPRLALVWDASLDTTFKLMYGKAFRAPAFTEQYSINNPVFRGNSGLAPERIQTLEAAASWQPRGDLQLVASVFRYNMSDIIRTQPQGDGAALYVNSGGQRGHGAELEGTWDPSRRLRLVTHVSYQRSTDKTANQDAGYAPHGQAFARLEWSAEAGWLISGQVKHVAGRARSAGDLRSPVADYTSADFTVRTRTNGSPWGASMSVRNAFNADVREPSLAPGASIPNDLPMAPRSVYLELSYRL